MKSPLNELKVKSALPSQLGNGPVTLLSWMVQHHGAVGIADLMKKGLRRLPSLESLSNESRNRRPDEEGIKTNAPVHAPLSRDVGIADLMKKGLRRPGSLPSCRPVGRNRRPDEEGIN